MKIPILLLFLGLPLLTALAQAQDDTPGKPLQLSPVTSDIAAVGNNALAGIGNPGLKVHGGINKNGVYTLTGDLFRVGRTFAVIDGSDEVILAEWKEHQWKNLGYLNIDTAWKFPGWKMYQEGTRDPFVTKPFWMISLQGRRLLVIASEVDKAGQNYTAVLFDPSVTYVSDSTDSFSLAPMVQDGYLVTGDASRNKSEFGINYFLRIKDNHFVTLGSWGESYPYRQPDSGSYSCCIANSGTTSYTFMDDYSHEKPPADIVIFEGDLGGGWEGIADAWEYDKAFAKLYFTPRRNAYINGVNQLLGDEYGYVFEKLTHFPRDLCGVSDDNSPKGDSGDQYETSGHIEDEATIRVTGDPSAVRLLMPPHQPTSK